MKIRLDRCPAYIIIGAIVLCIAGLAYQYLETRSLRLQVQEYSVSLEGASSDVVTVISISDDQESRIKILENAAGQTSGKTNLPPIDKLNALLAMSKDQETRIKILENVAGQTSGKINLPSVNKLSTFQPGFYQLTTNTRYDPDLEETLPYTISHVVVKLFYETYGTQLTVGLAKSGMFPKGVYFDYDNDGQIDVDMALNFVREIPVFGRSLVKAYDPIIAQNLYSIFVNESENADYTSLDDLRNDAEATSSYLWIFVESQYEAIEAWVLENLPDRPEEG